MAGTTSVTAKGTAARVEERRSRNATAYLPLALWRMRRMWPVLALVQGGMLCAVLLLCAVPLFTRVVTVAGLRGALTASPETAYFFAYGYTNTPTTANFDKAGRRSQSVLQRNFAAFGLSDATAFDLLGTPLPIATIDGAAGASGKMGFYGLTESALPGRMRVVAGRLPHPANGALEVAVTQETARQLNLHLGSSLLLGTSAAAGRDGVPLRIVGIVDPVPQEVRSYSAPGSLDPDSGQYWAVVSVEAVSQSAITWEAVAAFAGGQAGPQPPGYWLATWTYHASLSHLEQLDLREPTHYQQLRYQSGLELSNLPGISSAYVFGGAPDVLYSYAVRLQLAQVITFLLLVVVLGLVLLFLSLMANVLVERQEGLIALLRSRGASKGQITTAFFIQSVLLGVVALVAGALLAVPLVRGVAAALLPAGNAAALAVLDGGWFQTAASGALFALIAVVITVAGTFWTVRRAARRNVYMAGQEATRATTKPLWQRLYLDVIAALLALLGYGAFTLAMTLTTADPTLDSERTRYLLSPLALLAPPFLTIAAALLFVRLFPVALRLGERLAMGRRGAPALLALTQLARASRPALRITLLLALALGFALFTLNTLTTAGQRITDVALHQAGADFSGSPEASGSDATPAALAGKYRAIPGVVSATAGYRTGVLQHRQQQGSFDNPPILQLAAVDADTFAGTALWSTEDSTQPLAVLMALLRAGRARTEAEHVVPALLDVQLWKTLGLREGQTFTLPTPDQDTGEMRFLALREVQRIPTTMSSTGFNFGPPTGGMLVDYQSFAAAYASATGATSSAGTALAPNFVWLDTKSDAESLASVRAALAAGPLQLTSLQPRDGLAVPVSDRRALIAALHADPMYLDVTGALTLGATAALTLALLGTLVAVWLWMREQMTARALLRALGMGPCYLRRTLLCEQGIVFAAAAALGVVLGALLTAVASATLVDLMFNDILSSGADSASTADAPPVRMALSAPLLALGLGAVVVVLAAVAVVIARRGARPALAPVLRLNEG